MKLSFCLGLLTSCLFLAIIALNFRSSYGLSRTSAPGTNDTNKSCNLDKLDECGATLMVFGKRSVYLPKNHEEMAPHCQSEYEAEDCIKSFSRRCLNPFERQLLGMLCLGAGQVLRKRCSKEGTKDYLNHYRCIKKMINPLHDVMEQLIVTLITIGDGRRQEAIDLSCCSFARYIEYSTQVVRKGCQDFDPSAENYIVLQMIKGYSHEALELACPGYEHNNEKCRKRQLPSGGFEWKNNTLTKTSKGLKSGLKKRESIFVPYLSIMTSL